MESRKVLDIVAYYLSEFDENAFAALGFDNKTKCFDEIAVLFAKGG